MEKVPETMDWVSARAKCSVEHQFMLLCEVVNGDVQKMNTLAPQGTSFMFNKVSDTTLVVSSKRNAGGFIDGSNVVLEMTQTGLTVRAHRQPDPVFTATIGFGVADARCRFVVGGQPLELWQISQRALEGLFFG